MIKFENQSNGRFYYLMVNRDLLNDCVLHINFGGRDVSRFRSIPFTDRKTLQKEIDRISLKRLKRGYSLIT